MCLSICNVKLYGSHFILNKSSQMLGLVNKPLCLKAAKVAGVGAAVYGVGTFIIRWRKKSILRRKAAETKRRETAAILKQLEDLENEDAEEREEILAMDAQSLIAAIQQGKIDPVKVLHSFTYKACNLTKQLNCVTGLIQNAEQVALSLSTDSPEQYKLYGLPVSLKDNLETKGMDSCLGVAKFLGDPAKDDCVLAKVLKHCGAIPFVKTNLSQLMFSLDSSNTVFGATSNPHNLNFTTGGSSAGEGALIAAGGSLLGFGTDSGGSIRCPSHTCGIPGFKPSLNRISSKGLKHPRGPPGSVGPMSRNVDTLVLAMRALLCPLMFELDVDVPPLPFNEEIYGSKKKLRIGYYIDDDYILPVPAIQRAVSIAKIALEKDGHVLVPFQVPRMADAINYFMSACCSDGGQVIVDALKYEDVDPILQEMYNKMTIPSILRRIKCTLLWLKWPRIAQDLHSYGGGDRSVTRLRKIEAEILKYKEEFHSAWRDKNLDAVICPAFSMVAGLKGSFVDDSGLWTYAALYNLLNYPAGVVPVTEVNEHDMEALKSYKGHYDDPWDKHIKKTCEDSLGMPVGVQCVALPYNDEMCLRVMKEVETLLLVYN